MQSILKLNKSDLILFLSNAISGITSYFNENSVISQNILKYKGTIMGFVELVYGIVQKNWADIKEAIIKLQKEFKIDQSIVNMI